MTFALKRQAGKAAPKIAGADFSAVGVTRPVTANAHACVWGETGGHAILDWLDIPARYRYSRASALDRGEDDRSH